ncbi:hypothetical protein LSCM4_07400 [Leishmania orientalis]|uniref:Amastin-like surface protein-like protein n=1 Tax=Leishmania orientalis TaxID=2249476 RepID=A0A836HRX5_9TRYP|nr:hypothetical protein LSCM4_07400 [Leishmania orientalis]
MVSEDTKLTVMRGGVVLHAAAAALCLGATAMLPIFRLNIEKLNSSITQSLWTTDIYTPAAEKHIPVKSFVKNCHDLVTAFQVAQAATLVGIAALALAFLCAVFHISPTFTNSGYRVRTVCGAPICTLLLVAIIAAGTNCYIMHAMYENNWCEKNNAGYMAKADVPAAHVAVPAIMHLPSKELREVPHVRRLFATRTVTKMAVPLDIGIVAAPAEMHTAGSSGVLFGDCNPFDGCISSYREMGFTTAAGWQTTWAALTAAFVGLFAELTVMIIGGSRVAEAGVGESTIALLQGEDERLL